MSNILEDEMITLLSSEGEEIEFYPVAKIYLGHKGYAILQPVELIEGMRDDEALVFEHSEKNGDDHFDIVLDDDIIEKVFAEYNRLLDEQQNG